MKMFEASHRVQVHKPANYLQTCPHLVPIFPYVSKSAELASILFRSFPMILRSERLCCLKIKRSFMDVEGSSSCPRNNNVRHLLAYLRIFKRRKSTERARVVRRRGVGGRIEPQPVTDRVACSYYQAPFAEIRCTRTRDTRQS